MIEKMILNYKWRESGQVPSSHYAYVSKRAGRHFNVETILIKNLFTLRTKYAAESDLQDRKNWEISNNEKSTEFWPFRFDPFKLARAPFCQSFDYQLSLS